MFSNGNHIHLTARGFVLLLLLTLALTPSWSQCPTTAVNLSSQADVNAFPSLYPGCTVVPDGIDVEIMGADITDLSPLSQLTGALGAFEVRDCPLLTNLNGLHNITSFGNDALDGFILRDLPALTSISALNNLTSITGEFTIRTCNGLTTLTGLNNLGVVNGSVIVRDNAALQNLNGLNMLHFIGETLEIVENVQLTSVSALSNVDTIIGGPEGGIFFEANTILTNLTGLGNNSTVTGGNLDLLLNSSLSLCAVPAICNYLANPPVGAVITITGNVTGCNNQTEITAACAFISVTETNPWENEILVSPNPISDRFQIVTAIHWTTIDVLDASGRHVKTFNAMNGPFFSMQNCPAGMYYFKISDTYGQVQMLKVVK